MAKSKVNKEQLKCDKRTVKNLESHYITAKEILKAKTAAMEETVKEEFNDSYEKIVTLALSTLVGKVTDEQLGVKKVELEQVHAQHVENFRNQLKEEFNHNNSACMQLVSDYERAQTRIEKANRVIVGVAENPNQLVMEKTPEKNKN